MKTCKIGYAETPSDICTIVDLSNALFQEDSGTRDSYININWPREHGHSYFTEFIQKEDHHCLIATMDKQTVGYLAGYISETSNIRLANHGIIESIYILKQHRRRGLGTLLVNEFIDRIKKNNVRDGFWLQHTRGTSLASSFSEVWHPWHGFPSLIAIPIYFLMPSLYDSSDNRCCSI